MFGKVAVLMGGNSSEREVSLQTGKAVLDALVRKGVDAHAIDTKNDFILELLDGNFNCAFICLHGRGGEDGSIQGFLETVNIPYTGSKILGSAISMDKVRSKRIWQSLGLATLPFSVWKPGSNSEEYIKIFGLPLAIKPVLEGSSVGVAKVNSVNDFEIACQKASQYGPVMIEPWVIGDEYTVAILGDKPLPSIQIVSNVTFYDYEAKYVSDATQYICPSILDDDEEHNLRLLAKQAFDAVDATGWGRVDLMRDLNGDYWILEVNTVPGMTSHSLVPKAAKVAGLEFDDLVLEILSQAIGVTTKVNYA